MQLRKLLSCLLIGVVLASIPHGIVKGQSTSTISGTVRCGGGCDTVGLLYGEPINVAGFIWAHMNMALDPYTHQPRPDLPLQNAQTSFDATAHGRYELQEVEPGLFNLIASANGFPAALAAANVTVYADQYLSIDLYVCSGSGFVNGYCSPGAPSSSTAQASLTPSTPYTYSSASSAVTSSPSLQLPQLPQSTGSQPSSNMLQLGLVLAIIAAVMLCAVFLYSRRKQRKRLIQRKRSARRSAG
jgi:hypothetical protein